MQKVGTNGSRGSPLDIGSVNIVVMGVKSVNNVQSQLLMQVDSSQGALGLRSPVATTVSQPQQQRPHIEQQGYGKRMATRQHTMDYSVPVLLLLCGLFLVAVTVPGASARTCREASLCCNGRDSSCVVQKAPLNSIIEDPINDKPCYCDHACLKLGDCCEDFKQFCGGKS